MLTTFNEVDMSKSHGPCAKNTKMHLLKNMTATSASCPSLSRPLPKLSRNTQMSMAALMAMILCITTTMT